MVEYPVEENAVLEIMNEVNMAKHEASMKLHDIDFGASKRINREKKLILEGTPKRVSKKKK